MRYRVFDKTTKEDITDKYNWVITPDGKLYFKDYGDLIGDPRAMYVSCDEVVMIKFFIDDFNYEKRFGVTEPFGYLFNVRGESANYLRNKYELDYQKIFVNCYTDKTIYVGSRQYDNTLSECCECYQDDIEELYNILKPIIDVDMRNYEEYCCDHWYGKDDRW